MTPKQSQHLFVIANGVNEMELLKGTLGRIPVLVVANSGHPESGQLIPQ